LPYTNPLETSSSYNNDRATLENFKSLHGATSTFKKEVDTSTYDHNTKEEETMGEQKKETVTTHGQESSTNNPGKVVGTKFRPTPPTPPLPFQPTLPTDAVADRAPTLE
jgi:hypothetical protein